MPSPTRAFSIDDIIANRQEDRDRCCACDPSGSTGCGKKYEINIGIAKKADVMTIQQIHDSRMPLRALLFQFVIVLGLLRLGFCLRFHTAFRWPEPLPG